MGQKSCLCSHRCYFVRHSSVGRGIYRLLFRPRAVAWLFSIRLVFWMGNLHVQHRQNLSKVQFHVSDRRRSRGVCHEARGATQADWCPTEVAARDSQGRGGRIEKKLEILLHSHFIPESIQRQFWLARALYGSASPRHRLVRIFFAHTHKLYFQN